MWDDENKEWIDWYYEDEQNYYEDVDESYYQFLDYYARARICESFQF